MDTKVDVPDTTLSPLPYSSSGDTPYPSSTDQTDLSAALAEEEITRAKAWALCTIILPGTAACLAPFMSGDFEIKVGLCISALSYVLASIFILWRLRDTSNYTPQLFRIWGYSSVILTVPLQYCLGTFSPTPLIVTLGLSFFGFGRDRLHSVLIGLVATFLYLLLTLSILFGVVEDRGLLSSTGTPTVVLAFFAIMVPMVFLSGIFFSRASQRALLRALSRATEAQRLAGEREGQLLEAERELEAVLHGGAGVPGRYTGYTAGSHKLGPIIGRGAMGEVYAARHGDTNQRVAVKIIRWDGLDDPDRRERFLREGRIGGDLNVPNVTRVFEVGEIDEHTPYIAMEMLIGEDLRARLRKERRLSLDVCRDLCRHISLGIQAAHSAGVVHRDIKPQNIFCHQATEEDSQIWKILDFGVSKLLGANGTLTQGGIIGTPSYMAPEQARSEDVDHRCDIYGLGAVLYRALTGTAPFSGESPSKILYDVVYRIAERPSRLNPELPREVDAVLSIALAKSRANRFDSISELSLAFTEAVEGRISPGLKKRANKIHRRHPWGSRLTSDDAPTRS